MARVDVEGLRVSGKPEWAMSAAERTALQKWRFEQRQKLARRNCSRARQPTASGTVTVTSSDGSTEVRPAYGQAELRRIAPERFPISPTLRRWILERDGWACRYCGNSDGPFHVDHVLPVAHGGATVRGNLVTACQSCNLRKGTARWQPNILGSHTRRVEWR